MENAVMENSLSMFPISRSYGLEETFRCDGCQRVLKKAWTDADAMAEMQERFPGADASQTMILCDECVNELNLDASFGNS
jgi:hypothetical protein